MKVLRLHERLETEREKYPYFVRTLSKCQLYRDSTEVKRKGLVSLEGKEREIEVRATFLFQRIREFLLVEFSHSPL